MTAETFGVEGASSIEEIEKIFEDISNLHNKKNGEISFVVVCKLFSHGDTENAEFWGSWVRCVPGGSV